MNHFIEADVKEDCVIFSLNDNANMLPRDRVKHELQEYITRLHEMEEKESDPRVVEIDECHCRYAELLLEHIDAGKDLPRRKSYSLNV